MWSPPIPGLPCLPVQYGLLSATREQSLYHVVSVLKDHVLISEGHVVIGEEFCLVRHSVSHVRKYCTHVHVHVEVLYST